MTTRVSTVFIRTAGVWLGISDETCRVNRPDFWHMSRPPETTLAELRQLDDAGELLSWTSVLDGGFVVRLVESEDDSDFRSPSVADVDQMGMLKVPSGRLMLRSARIDGAPIEVLVLEPGLYRTRLQWFVEEESKHYDVQSARQYPERDGPDGIVTLRRIGDLRREPAQ